MSKVALIGGGMIGTTLAHLLAYRSYDVVMVDIKDSVKGKSLDLRQSSAIGDTSFHFCGSCDYDDIQNADICIITAGFPRTSDISRDDLLSLNGKVISDVAHHVSLLCPDAIVICVTNPVDTMTYLFQRKSGIPRERVMGMSGILDVGRFKYFLSQEIGVSPKDIQAIVLGGHGDSMVFPKDYITISGVPISYFISDQKLEEIITRTRYGGGEIVKLIGSGSAYYAPAQSIYNMIDAIVHNTNRLLCCSSYLSGQYGYQDLYLGVPCFLSSDGIGKVMEISLDKRETDALNISANNVKEINKKSKDLFG